MPQEITAAEAWRLLGAEKNAALIDVRTPEEWAQAAPDLSGVGKIPVLLSWVFAPDRRRNAHFEEEIVERFPEKDTPMVFMCSAGGRSGQAAETLARFGYTRCLNMINGFERMDGEHPEYNGWQAAGLPWKRGA